MPANSVSIRTHCSQAHISTCDTYFCSVVSKLRELGWGDELDRIAPHGYQPLRDHAHVRLSKPLANRGKPTRSCMNNAILICSAGWLNIRDDIIDQMWVIKKKRLRAERCKLVYERLTVLNTVITAARTAPPKRTAADEYKPKCRDRAMMPVVRKLIEAPNDTAINEQSLQSIVSMLPALEARWQRERRADLARALRDEHVEVRDGVDILDLAVAVFQCKDCKRYLHHPHVLMHECVTIPLLCGSPDFRYADYFKCIFEACGSRIPWSVTSYRVPPKLDRVRALVEMCGLDPKAATQSDMDRIGGKLVYDEPDFGATLMSWRCSVSWYRCCEDLRRPC